MSKNSLFHFFTGLILCSNTVLASNQEAWPLNASVTVAQESNYLGIRQTSGNFAVKGDITISANNGLYGSIALSGIDYIAYYELADSNNYEVDYILGYFKQFNNNWAYSTSLGRYTYHTDTPYPGYDYSELLLTADYRNRISFSVAVIKNLNRYDKNSHLFEINTQHPLKNHWVLQAGLGHIYLGRRDNKHYSYANVGIHKQYKRYGFGLSYITNSSQAEDVYGQRRSEDRLNASLSIHF